MELDKLSENWLFRQHSKHTIREWVRQLRYFYFKRAWGGHANDGDDFQVGFIFSNKDDLVNKIGLLGLALNSIPETHPRPVLGQLYSTAEFEKFKSEIQIYPDLEQPGRSVIYGFKTFIWVNENSIKISISGTKDNNRYEVSEEDFIVCLELEKHFDKLGWQNVHDKSLEKDICCISRSRYPELF